ncbi:TatD family deoxyribonuclease [Muribaculaceae bacterium Isolate-013 (NCI)]|jgi:TatD DNase family protein|nr:TatD family deoxyribonuclease [Muribaculaceae bacterium Isolate-013 (NCI)]
MTPDMDTGRNHLLSDLHRFTDIHAHLAPESCEAPAGVLVSLTPAEAVRVLGRPGVAGEYSVGIHPWDSGAPADWDALEALLRHPAAVAVGECGLDALRGPGIGRQEEVLRRHIELSERLGKPLILHVVRAMEPLLRIRREMAPRQPWIWHGFRGKPPQAAQLVRAGIALSLGPVHNKGVPPLVPPLMLFRESDSAV